MTSGNAARNCNRGFSLIELLIVVAIGMIAAAMALPLVSNAVNQIHLSSSATDYANLLQRARMRAVQDDTYYQIQTQTLSGDPIAYVDINKNGSYDTGEPMMVFASGVTYKAQSAGPALSNLKSQFLPLPRCWGEAVFLSAVCAEHAKQSMGSCNPESRGQNS